MTRKDNNQKLNQCNILSAITADDIIYTDNVQEAIMNAQKERLLSKMHPYKITEPKSENGRWQTYYRDANGERKIIRAQTKDALLEKLIPIYFQESHLDKFIFSDLFLEWLEYKKTVTDSPNTIKRHKQHYRRYFEKSELYNMPVRRIDALLLESECNRLVKEYSMSRKEWNNVKTILIGCFEYATRKKYITDNPMNDVKILVKYRQVVKKTGKTETYNTEELEDLNKYLDKMYAETEDTVFLAAKMNFLLGLRVGELVALKWEDCKEQFHIHVVREEVRNQETNFYSVVEHTKTNHDRYVPLVPKAISILEKIPKQGSYIFMRDGERITARQVAYVLEKYAQRHGKKTKSTHKMRKTYASNLSANNVPLDSIREILGHSSLSTTLGYIYNPLTESETYNLIVKAL